MSTSKTLLSAAVATVVATTLVGTPLTADAHKQKMEKCYGIAKKAKNDCGTPRHGCAGQAVKDSDPEEWLFVPKGLCKKIVGGSLSSDQKSTGS